MAAEECCAETRQRGPALSYVTPEFLNAASAKTGAPGGSGTVENMTCLLNRRGAPRTCERGETGRCRRPTRVPSGLIPTTQKGILMGLIPPSLQTATTGLMVTVSGANIDVTPDPPVDRGSWSTLRAVLPPVAFAGGDATTPLQVWAANQAAEFDGGVQVNGVLQVNDTKDEDAVVSTSGSKDHAAVAAHNSGGGFAFWGSSTTPGGSGIYATGATQAAQFDGAVNINGDLKISGTLNNTAIQQLQAQVQLLQQQVKDLQSLTTEILTIKKMDVFATIGQIFSNTQQFKDDVIFLRSPALQAQEDAGTASP